MIQLNSTDLPKLYNVVKDDLSLFSLDELKILEDKIITKMSEKTGKQTHYSANYTVVRMQTFCFTWNQR